MDLITASEKQQLQERLSKLISNRKVISARIAEARELGDLKENSEYHAAREQQGLEEAEIRRLEDRLATAQVADGEMAKEAGTVFLGTRVLLREVDSGDEDEYQLVGESSGDPMLDYIEVTMGSPMGEALMKARVGEIVTVKAPRGDVKFEVVEIL